MIDKVEAALYLELGARVFGDMASENGPAREGCLVKRFYSAGPGKPSLPKIIFANDKFVWSSKLKDVFRIQRKSKKGNFLVVNAASPGKQLVLLKKDCTPFEYDPKDVETLSVVNAKRFYNSPYNMHKTPTTATKGMTPATKALEEIEIPGPITGVY